MPLAQTAACTAILWLLIALSASASVPRAEQGVIDLRSWSFSADGAVALDGEWQFYWQELLAPEQVSDAAQLQNVPQSWKRYTGNLPTEGYASYRLTVQLPPGRHNLAIYNPGQYTSTAIWVNGERYQGSGEIGTTRADTVPSKKRIALFLGEAEGELQLNLQIANFHHRKAGFSNALVLGLPEDVHNFQRREWISDALFVGITLCVGIYFLLMYGSRRDDYATLYFSLLCITISLRSSLVNQSLLAWLMPDSAWQALLKVEYLSFYWALSLFAGYLRALYPEEYSRKLLIVSGLLAGAFSVATLLSPTLLASQLIPGYQGVYLIFLAIMFHRLYYVVINRRQYHQYIAGASVIMTVLIIMDMLYVMDYQPLANLSRFSLLVFILVQAGMLSRRSADTYHRITQITEELEARNERLRESEETYRSLFEDSFDTIFVSSKTGHLVDISPACERLIGYTPAELRTMRDLDLLGRESDRIKFAREMSSSGNVVDFRTELRHKAGHMVPVMVTATMRGGNPEKGYQGYVRNLSDQLEAIEQRHRAEQLAVIATLDPLTSVYNRRHFEQAARRERARSSRNNTALALLILDIDHFKQVNDEYGHLAGDEVLVAVAHHIRGEIRATDVMARYGGEEFVLLMPETTAELAVQRGRQLGDGLSQLEIKRESVNLKVTVSIGVADWPRSIELEEALLRADQALYRAKAEGRDRLELWQEDALATVAKSV